MRDIEFKTNVNNLTKIFVDGVELETKLDPTALRAFRTQRRQLPPAAGQQIVDALAGKLKNDNVTLTPAESKHILDHVREELGIA